MDNINITVTANNSEDILIRITTVFHKRGFKIKALTFLEDKDKAKLLITAHGEKDKQDQIIRQLCKLYDINEAEMAY